MIRSACPLLFGLGLCVASGCASVGAGGRVALNDRPSGNRQSSAKVPMQVVSDQVVSAKVPEQDSRTASDSTDSEFTGHSPSIGKSNPAIVPAGHPDGATRRVDPAVNWSSSDDPGVRNANFRSDRDGTGNPVELQGLQLEPTEPGEQDGQNSGLRAIPGDGDPSAAHLSPRTPGPWQADLEHLIARAERELTSMTPGADPSEYRRRQVDLRLLYLLARHPEQALTAIPSLDPVEQEYWQEMVWAITNSLDVEEQLSPRERAAQAIPPVSKALRRLREQADLSLRNAAFCEEISYFGNYKRFPKEEFVPGQPVLLYAEIENFRSEPSASTGEYRTLLRSLIEIVGANGQIRWKKSFAATEDLCRNPRRDYFHNYQFTIPERLPLGPHTLKLTVVDELSGKQATSEIRFMVR